MLGGAKDNQQRNRLKKKKDSVKPQLRASDSDFQELYDSEDEEESTKKKGKAKKPTKGKTTPKSTKPETKKSRAKKSEEQKFETEIPEKEENEETEKEKEDQEEVKEKKSKKRKRRDLDDSLEDSQDEDVIKRRKQAEEESTKFVNWFQKSPPSKNLADNNSVNAPDDYSHIKIMKRVTKTNTLKEGGYLVTKSLEESVLDEEATKKAIEAAKNTKKSQHAIEEDLEKENKEVKQAKKSENSDSDEEIKKPAAKKRKTDPNMKQGNIMSFFTKKS